MVSGPPAVFRSVGQPKSKVWHNRNRLGKPAVVEHLSTGGDEGTVVVDDGPGAYYFQLSARH